MDSPHYKNCVSDEKNMPLILLNAKENIFYEQELAELVVYRQNVESEYKKVKNSMKRDLYGIQNEINDEWSRMSLLQRLGNYFSIRKKRQERSEACQKKYELALGQHKKKFEVIDQEVQSFTNPANRKSLSRSWMKKSDAKKLKKARKLYEQYVRE
jgi:hypothetical protein